MQAKAVAYDFTRTGSRISHQARRDRNQRNAYSSALSGTFYPYQHRCYCIKDNAKIDPCAGSGHIICYLFDILLQIYESYGYTTTEAVSSIVENNLYGLDIDERAAQLAYFAVMMKARSYDRRFFLRGIQPHVYAIPESNDLDKSLVDYFVGNDPKLKKDFGTLAEELHDAKEYGSILNVSQVDFDAMLARAEEIKNAGSLYLRPVTDLILPLIQAGQVLAQKYHVVVTNPPYMGAGNMGEKLSDLVKKNYPDSKSDLFAVFMERCGRMTAENGYQAMITQHAWMFLSSFEKLREKIMRRDIVSMAHLGPRAFEEIGGEVVQTTSFVLRQSHTAGYKGTYCRLIEPTTQQGKEDLFLAGENRYTAQQSNFSKIPGSPVAYWVGDTCIKAFDYPRISEYFTAIVKGIFTGDNARFLRFWHEIEFHKMKTIWIPYNKGGNFRRW